MYLGSRNICGTDKDLLSISASEYEIPRRDSITESVNDLKMSSSNQSIISSKSQQSMISNIDIAPMKSSSSQSMISSGSGYSIISGGSASSIISFGIAEQDPGKGYIKPRLSATSIGTIASRVSFSKTKPQIILPNDNSTNSFITKLSSGGEQISMQIPKNPKALMGDRDKVM